MSPLVMASNDTGVGKNGKKRRFSTNKSLYLGNDKRYGIYNHNEKLIGNHIWDFDWYQF